MQQTITLIGKWNGVIGPHTFEMNDALPEPTFFLDKDEIVSDLLNRLDESTRQALKNRPRSNLILLHNNFGMDIRNAYGMWFDENPHTNNEDEQGDTHADQYSFQVIEALYEKLNETKTPYAAYDAAMKGVR